MKRWILFSSLVAVSVIFVSSCEKDNIEDLTGGGNDTIDSNAVYTYQDVAPLLSAYSCLGCHNAGSASGGVNLDGYQNVRTWAESGELMGAINWENGFTNMPPSGGQMTEADRYIIQNWIDNGYQN